MLVPLASQNYYLLLVCRFMTGVGQANFWPGMWNWWSYWYKLSKKNMQTLFFLFQFKFKHIGFQIQKKLL